MRLTVLLVMAIVSASAATAGGGQDAAAPAAPQAKPSTSKPSTSKPATTKPSSGAQSKPATPPPPRTEPAILSCPSLLGDGVQRLRTYCDVLIGDDPAAGIIIMLPEHAGDVTLTFDLHNRHTYSAEQVKANKAFSRYTATIGVLTMNNDLLSRAVVFNEFRTEVDLFDRIKGGSGPGGLKAVAPSGLEPISIVIPEVHQTVSILGEKLSVVRVEGVDNFSTIGRPIAVISNVRVTYAPPPPPPPPKAPARAPARSAPAKPKP
jgi:hypothetical protein